MSTMNIKWEQMLDTAEKRLSREKKVLVVDNNPVILSFMNNLLLKNDYQVSTAEDGLTVLKILETFTPDIIIMDFIMPNINGEKLCRMIRKMPHMKDAYIIILSAVAAEHEIWPAVKDRAARGAIEQERPHSESGLDGPGPVAIPMGSP